MRTSFWTRAFDLIAPRLCAICKQRLAPNESILCSTCHLQLPLTRFETQAQDNEMARLFWGLIPIERAAALFFYSPHSSVAQLVYDLKYHHHAEIGYHLGRIMGRQLSDAAFFEGIDAIVPTPLTRMRQWRRGYNQSELIARGMAEVCGLPIYNKVVKRVAFNSSQTQLNKWQRQQNTQDVFRLMKPELVHGRHLLLIDDVVTTGATLISLAEAIQQAGDVRFSMATIGFTKS